MRVLRNLLILFSIIVVPLFFFNLRMGSFIDPSLAPYYNAAMKPIKEYCYMTEYAAPNRVYVEFNYFSPKVECSKNFFRYIVSVNPVQWSLSTEDERMKYIFTAVAECTLDIEIETNENTYIFLYKYETAIQRHCTLWNHSQN